MSQPGDPSAAATGPGAELHELAPIEQAINALHESFGMLATKAEDVLSELKERQTELTRREERVRAAEKECAAQRQQLDEDRYSFWREHIYIRY